MLVIGSASMTLKHFTIHNQADMRWHACYHVAGGQCASSIGSAITKDGADKIANEANRAQAAQDRAAELAALHPADRPLVSGFYTDLDAA